MGVDGGWMADYPAGIDARIRLAFSMRDPYWRAAWDAVAPLLAPQDCIVAPPGEWPETGCVLRTYVERIELRGASVLFLHKGKIGGLKKPMLRYIMLAWQCVFANEVFVCFVRRRNTKAAAAPEHLGRLRQYVHSRSLKRVPNTVFFVHLPKAAGTSVWEFLSERVPSAIYYDTLEAFLYNPPQRGEYDLVGGHVPLPVMAPYIGPEDRVAAVIREPTARFRSAFLHARRPGEDPATFSPIMQAMRHQPLGEFLASYDGQMELRQQLLMLGHDLSYIYHERMDEQIRDTAISWVRDSRSVFRTVEQVDDLIGCVAALLGINAAGEALAIRNRSDPEPAGSCVDEFDAHVTAIETGNAIERSLHVLVGGRDLDPQ